MQFQGLRVHVIFLALAAGMVLLFGLQRMYQFSQVDKPLKTFFARQAEVKSYAIGEKGGDLRISVVLGPVANLRETYVTIEEGAKDILGGRPFELDIRDNRDAQLLDDFYRLHYDLEEALATGEFTAMSADLKRKEKEMGLGLKVFVDSRYLYVQLMRGDRYLYEILPRTDAGQTPPVTGVSVRRGRQG